MIVIYLIDIGAYSLPVVTSILWLYHDSLPPVELISLSNLLLDLKFMLFLRAFRYFGRYFAIILGVARKVFSFLMILFLIVLSFSHAFYILLKPLQENYTLDNPDFRDDDPNSPWNLTSKYFTYFTNNSSYNQDSIIVQQPDGNTNMFVHFHSSMLAMYNFLAGNNILY